MPTFNDRWNKTPATKKETDTPNDYCYFSKITNKAYDTLEELRAAETEVRKAEDAKKLASETKKLEAEKVQKAITDRVEAERQAKKEGDAAYQEYLKKLDEIKARVKQYKTAEKEALNNFCAKYGAYHSTFKIGDGTYTFNYSTEDETKLIDPFKDFINFWLN